MEWATPLPWGKEDGERFDPPARYVYPDPVNRVVSPLLALLALLPLLALLAPSLGCTVLLAPGEQQCETTQDCTNRGFSGAVCTANVCQVMVDPIWGCLGHVVEPVPDPTMKVTFAEKLTYTDQSPVTMATVDVCDKLDLDCTSTDPDYPKGLMPGPDGTVNLTVIQGFDGFVRISGPTVMDSRVFVGRPIVTPPSVKSVRLLEPSEYQLLAGYAKQVVDPTRGTAILLAVDCSDNSASGVSFTCAAADSGSQAFYLINQAPTPPPTATSTDVDGFGGYLNLPVGLTVAQSYRASDDTLVGQSSFDVLANTISYVQIAPTPMLP